MSALTLGAIGVVYGDIGTSPLYAFKEVFVGGHVTVTEANLLGILSLFIWTLTIIVSVKYVTLIMRADNHGEGGLMALLALASQSVKDRPKVRNALLMVGVFGVALFFGDGIITPAISVLSAVEGVEILAPAAKPYVVPMSLAVLLMLFAVQRRGTAAIGKLFGPVMVLWFGAMTGMGVVQIAANPSVLRAISPIYGLRFGADNPGIAFITLGAIFLCVTGAEALYADMGHFGMKPIRIAWFFLVMPALMINYLGQGALVLSNPKAVENPFYLMAPPWALLPLVVLATAATVIASQALISGAFSATKQTIQLGYLPRLSIVHTSERDTGQIYLPAVNWALLIGVVIAVLLFGSSTALAGAYGISVSLVMVMTTVLTFYVIHYGWGYPLWLCIAASAFFFTVDVAFFASNSLKIVEGGWFPLSMALVLYVLLSTWKRGRALLSEKIREDSLDLKEFLPTVFLQRPHQVSGTAVFLTGEPGKVPNAFLHNLKHNKVMHEQNLFVTVRGQEVPNVPPEQKLIVIPLGSSCWQVLLNFGFMENPDVPSALTGLGKYGCTVDPSAISYFLSRDTVIPTVGGRMARWRERLFAQMYLNSSGAADFLHLPNNSVVELGSKIEI